MDDPPEYSVVEDLRVNIRLLRYCPLAVQEFTYAPNEPPQPALNLQRERDFVWRFMQSLRDAEGAAKQNGRFRTPLTQLLRHADLFESDTGNVEGIWDRHYRGELPSPDSMELPYWNNRAAVSAAAALLKYIGGSATTVDQNFAESLLRHGQLISFWAGSLAAETVRWSLPESLHKIATNLAQDYVQLMIAAIVEPISVVRDYDEAVRTHQQIVDTTVYGIRVGAAKLKLGALPITLVEEIPHLITAHFWRRTI